MIGQIYHVGAVCVQKCSILILHNQLAVRLVLSLVVSPLSY